MPSIRRNTRVEVLVKYYTQKYVFFVLHVLKFSFLDRYEEAHEEEERGYDVTEWGQGYHEEPEEDWRSRGYAEPEEEWRGHGYERGYEHSYDRGYDGGGYNRGYDDRGYDRGYDGGGGGGGYNHGYDNRGYDNRGYDDRGYDHTYNQGHSEGYGHREEEEDDRGRSAGYQYLEPDEPRAVADESLFRWLAVSYASTHMSMTRNYHGSCHGDISGAGHGIVNRAKWKPVTGSE